MGITTILPHGELLVNRLLQGEEGQAARANAKKLPTITLNQNTLSDLEMIAVGAFSPITGFMNQIDYYAVLHKMQLANDLIWTLPITLAVTAEEISALRGSERAALCNDQGVIVGDLSIEDVYSFDPLEEARLVYQTTDLNHPGVARLFQRGRRLLGGPVRLWERQPNQFPRHHLDPMETRAAFSSRGWKRVVGFQTRNPIHRAHEYIQKAALETMDGLFIHPLVGDTKEDDIPATVRMKTYESLLSHYYPEDRALLAVFPAAMRYAGPREAVFHALVRQNYGCTHFIVGRDHAGVGNYYDSYAAQEIFSQLPASIQITPLFFEHTYYCRKCGNMASSKTCPHQQEDRLILSGTKVREMLYQGQKPPAEFTRPEVAEILIQGLSASTRDG